MSVQFLGLSLEKLMLQNLNYVKPDNLDVSIERSEFVKVKGENE